MSFFGGSEPKRMLCGEPKESRFPLAPYVYPEAQQKESKSTGAKGCAGAGRGPRGFGGLNHGKIIPPPSLPAAVELLRSGWLFGWLARSLRLVGGDARFRCSALHLLPSFPLPLLRVWAST